MMQKGGGFIGYCFQFSYIRSRFDLVKICNRNQQVAWGREDWDGLSETEFAIP